MSCVLRAKEPHSMPSVPQDRASKRRKVAEDLDGSAVSSRSVRVAQLNSSCAECQQFALKQLDSVQKIFRPDDEESGTKRNVWKTCADGLLFFSTPAAKIILSGEMQKLRKEIPACMKRGDSFQRGPFDLTKFCPKQGKFVKQDDDIVIAELPMEEVGSISRFCTTERQAAMSINKLLEDVHDLLFEASRTRQRTEKSALLHVLKRSVGDQDQPVQVIELLRGKFTDIKVKREDWMRPSCKLSRNLGPIRSARMAEIEGAGYCDSAVRLDKVGPVLRRVKGEEKFNAMTVHVLINALPFLVLVSTRPILAGEQVLVKAETDYLWFGLCESSISCQAHGSPEVATQCGGAAASRCCTGDSKLAGQAGMSAAGDGPVMRCIEHAMQSIINAKVEADGDTGQAEGGEGRVNFESIACLSSQPEEEAAASLDVSSATADGGASEGDWRESGGRHGVEGGAGGVGGAKEDAGGCDGEGVEAELRKEIAAMREEFEEQRRAHAAELEGVRRAKEEAEKEGGRERERLRALCEAEKQAERERWAAEAEAMRGEQEGLRERVAALEGERAALARENAKLDALIGALEVRSAGLEGSAAKAEAAERALEEAREAGEAKGREAEAAEAEAAQLALELAEQRRQLVREQLEVRRLGREAEERERQRAQGGAAAGGGAGSGEGSGGGGEGGGCELCGGRGRGVVVKAEKMIDSLAARVVREERRVADLMEALTDKDAAPRLDPGGMAEGSLWPGEEVVHAWEEGGAGARMREVKEREQRRGEHAVRGLLKVEWRTVPPEQFPKDVKQRVRRAAREMLEAVDERERDGLPQLPCGDRVEVFRIGGEDARGGLRGQWGLRAAKDLEAGEVLGVYAGQVGREGEQGMWEGQLRNAYWLSMPQPAGEQKAEGQGLLVDPWRKGNQFMFMNDYRSDPLRPSEPSGSGEEGCGAGPQGQERQNAAFVPCYWKGWPYCLVVATQAVDRGAELLVDYSEEYWALRKQQDGEWRGLFEKLRDMLQQFLAHRPHRTPALRAGTADGDQPGNVVVIDVDDDIDVDGAQG